MTPERYRVRGVEVFSAGNHRGKEYTERDLDDMVANFLAHCTGPSPLMRPPAKIGHADSQDHDESGKPAAGWPSKLWREGKILRADIEEMSPAEARLIQQRRFRKVSAEVYDEDQAHAAGLPAKGKMLRAVAFLGGDVPQVKGLADVPMPQRYSETTPPPPIRLHITDITSLPGGAWAIFSEVTRVDRTQELLQQLAKHGIDTGALQGVPEAALSEMLRVCDAKGEAKPAGFDEDNMPDGEVPEPKSDAEKQTYRERAKKYRERGRRYGERCGMKMGEDKDEDVEAQSTMGAVDEEPKKKPDESPEKYSERRTTWLVNRAVKAALAGVSGSLSEARKFSEDLKSSQKKQSVDALVEELVTAGKLPPAERESERQGLLLLDAGIVHKFSEAGKTVSVTAFDQRVKQLRSRPSTFGERFKDPVRAEEAGQGEKAKVEAHYERFSETFHRMDTSKEDFVKAFEARRKTEPALTAERYLGIRAS